MSELYAESRGWHATSTRLRTQVPKEKAMATDCWEWWETGRRTGPGTPRMVARVVDILNIISECHGWRRNRNFLLPLIYIFIVDNWLHWLLLRPLRGLESWWGGGLVGRSHRMDQAWRQRLSTQKGSEAHSSLSRNVLEQNE